MQVAMEHRSLCGLPRSECRRAACRREFVGHEEQHSHHDNDRTRDNEESADIHPVHECLRAKKETDSKFQITDSKLQITDSAEGHCHTGQICHLSTPPQIILNSGICNLESGIPYSANRLPCALAYFFGSRLKYEYTRDVTSLPRDVLLRNPF